MLLAEDERINQLYMLHLLQGAGHEVTLANDGEEVLAQLRERQFDLVLMDVQMPRLSGLEAAECIRLDGEFASASTIPIIALSAHSSAKDLESFRSAGMNDALTKPIDEEALLALIKSYERNNDT